MALFSKSDPLASEIANRDKLRRLLAADKSSHEAALNHSNRLASDGVDTATLKVARADVRECSDVVTERLNALARSDAEIVRLGLIRDDEADQKQRNETVVGCHKLEAELVKEGELIAASAARFSDIAARIIPIAPEANGLKGFSDVLVAQIPEAVALLSRLIREHAAAVLRREAPSKLKQPEAPVVVPIVQKPVRVSLFAMHSLKFTDPDSGKLIVAKQFRDVEMPPAFAKVALDHKVCVRLSDPLRKQHQPGRPAGHAEPLHAFDLDFAMTEKAQGPRLVEPIRSSNPNPQFAETIGSPRKAFIS
jgi:hypothetical protein